MGIPVYDLDGETKIADSVVEAAAHFQVTPKVLRRFLVLHRDGWRLTGSPAPLQRAPLPVYAESGATLVAPNIKAAAVVLDLPEGTLRRRLTPHRDGVRVLPANPYPANRLRVVAPDGRNWDSVTEAAAALGCGVKALRAIGREPGSRREGQTIILGRLPEYAGQVGGVRPRAEKPRPPCTVGDCGKPSVGRGLCRTDR